MVTNSLSRKSVHMAMMMLREEQLLEEFKNLSLEVSVYPKSLSVNALMIQNDLEDHIRETLPKDPYLEEAKALIAQDKTTNLKLTKNELIKFRNRLYVPAVGDLREIY